jgi:hypothetical protein
LNEAGEKHLPQFKELRNSLGHRRKVFDTDIAPHPRMRFRVVEGVQLYLHYTILQLLGYDNLITNTFDEDRVEGVPNTHYLLPERAKYDGVNTRIDNYFRNDPTLLFSCDMSKSTHLYGHRKNKFNVGGGYF